MKKTLLVFMVFTVIHVFSQKITIEPTIKVTYDSKLQLGEKYSHYQKFILIGNSKDYYFAAGQNYLNDTKQYIPSGIDTQAISDYFEERLIRKDGVTNIYVTAVEAKLRYQEKIDLKWMLYSETKMINGIKCQMAATNKYGRRWIAYFSRDYPQSLGPYKFTGLPGLILELYDTRDDYHFTASKIEKHTKTFAFNLGEYKNFPKEKYLKAKYNMDFTMAAFDGIEGEDKRNLEKALEKLKKMYNNPLELKPLE
ncbi:GLPGLI family protein [Chryseobacterium echinoideorum]|uniref:GLPGLI family protein n=1 Tax=Chryseobacterium echinoideorum TaxID=1549648 RepID=UPI0011864123|nr:GLPGLI family protein [Chryseobacterium echinoideorum]